MIDTSVFVLTLQFNTDNLSTEMKIDDADKEIPDTSELL